MARNQVISAGVVLGVESARASVCSRLGGMTSQLVGVYHFVCFVIHRDHGGAEPCCPITCQRDRGPTKRVEITPRRWKTTPGRRFEYPGCSAICTFSLSSTGNLHGLEVDERLTNPSALRLRWINLRTVALSLNDDRMMGRG